MREETDADDTLPPGHEYALLLVAQEEARLAKLHAAYESAGPVERVRGYCDHMRFILAASLAEERAGESGELDAAEKISAAIDAAHDSPFMPDTSDQLAGVN